MLRRGFLTALSGFIIGRNRKQHMATLRGPYLIIPDQWENDWGRLWSPDGNHGDGPGPFHYGNDLFMLAWDSNFWDNVPDILRSTDQGATWEHLNLAFPDLSGWDYPQQWYWLAYRVGDTSHLRIVSDQGDYAQVLILDFDMANPSAGLVEVSRGGEGGWTPDTWLTRGFYNPITSEDLFLFYPRPSGSKQYISSYHSIAGWLGPTEICDLTGMAGSTGMRAAIDTSGVTHVFVHIFGTGLNRVYYVRRATDGSLAAPILALNNAVEFQITGGNPPKIINDSIVLPNSQTGNFLIGTPVSAPVWVLYDPAPSATPQDAAVSPDGSNGRLWWIQDEPHRICSRSFDGINFGDVEEVYVDGVGGYGYYLTVPCQLASGKWGFALVQETDDGEADYYFEWTKAALQGASYLATP